MTPRSDGDFLETVRASADIREIISGCVQLKKIGGRYRGLCPFHSEKTPSFHVDPGKQLFYCFGCGTGGDVFKFLMLFEKVDFPEALRILARRYGIPEPERNAAGYSERQALLKLLRAALEFFRENLRKGSGADAARRYAKERGLSAETIDSFQVGFAPARWDGLKAHLLKAGFPERQLLAAGVLVKAENSDRTYDRFRNRLIFPIHSLREECLGFGGRILGEGEPKYLNSPETPLFHKGEVLYGLNRTAEEIRKREEAILVEGYLDFLSLYQSGFRNLAAVLGTGFSANHARLLGRFARRAIVNFDPDSAGQAATRRSLDVLLESGFEVRVLRLPGGKDPDRFVREEGAEAYRRLSENAPSYLEYLAHEAAGKVDLSSAAGKIEALNLVLPYVARLENAVARSEQVKLLSSLFRIQDAIVLQELKSTVAGRKTNLKSIPLEGTIGASSGSPAARLVRILIDEPEARRTLLPVLRDEDLEGSEVERIWHVVRDLARSGAEISYPRIGSLLPDPADQAFLVKLAALPGPALSVGDGEECLKSLRRRPLARRMQALQERLEQAPAGSNVDDLLRKKMDLRREMRALKNPPAP
ncbi:MAG TPA: DNA primase [Candidatus Polarisedimenticolia bacterium]|jgi:DNA primase|nr:DNA primase [Candidatus Polarisedimenticolia bacterium]